MRAIVVKKRSYRPFAEELPDLLTARGLSQRKLAQLVDLNPSHLSRVLRGVSRPRPPLPPAMRIGPTSQILLQDFGRDRSGWKMTS